MREMIQRATADFDVTGRTLEGMAVYWDRPTRVTDDKGQTYYREAYARTSADKSIRERGTFPLLYFHSLMPNMPGARSRWASEPFGPVVFRAAKEGLAFTTTLSKTQGADEMLELLNDKVIGDVSIGAYPILTRAAPNVDAYRVEIALAELSLAPIGMGQHPGARVEVVRAAAVDNRARMQRLKLHLH